MPGGLQSSNLGAGYHGQNSQSMEGEAASGGPKGLSDKVDLNDLEWEDRERVLRLLFSKMNAGNPSNTAQTKQNLKQSQVRDNALKQISEEGIRHQVQHSDVQEEHIK